MTDEHLMLEVRGGSRPAFEALFERYKDAVWRFYRRRIDDPGRAEELAQDVFVAVLQDARRYEPRAAFRRYLFGIACNHYEQIR
jgi:RNA polymerase sigma-70 factor, ECF subfamily